MSRIEELEKQAKSILEEIEKLKKEEKVESKVWKPKESEIYYHITIKGNPDEYEWGDDLVDNALYDIGNCFKTKEEAEKAVEKLKIYTQLKRLAEEINTEPIDWKNDEQCKYYLCMGIDVGDEYFIYIDAHHGVHKQVGQIYCTNDQFSEIAKERIGEENLLKLFKE